MVGAVLAQAGCGATAQPTEAALIVPGGGAEPIVESTSPYGVELIGEDGGTLPTYAHGGRYYVLGDAGERYTIRVSNPTDRRIEAVLSVDGLDAIDGEAADFLHKRGYVIPAGGEIRLEGWRVSHTAVAAFRFSSVRSSYAGRKGQPRNVGVIGVAIFREREQPAMVLEPQPEPYWGDDRRDYDGELEGGAGTDVAPPASSAPRKSSAPAEDSASESAPIHSRDVGRAEKSTSRPSPNSRTPIERPGLGTGFGEERHSAVMWTSFERETPGEPTALAELRYNDATGLAALGIPIQPQLPDEDELVTRETADPFPNTRFAQPPQ